MLSSSSVQKFHNDKVPKKNKKFKNCKVKNSITTVGYFKSDDPGTDCNNKMSTEKTFNESLNFKDFPELKSFRKCNNKSSYENSSNEPLTAAIIGNQKKSLEAFPAFLDTTSLNIDNVNLIKIEENFTETVLKGRTSDLSKTHPEVRFEMPVNANININNGINISSSKKASVQPQVNIKKKKRTDPVLINFQDILNLSKIQRKKKQLNAKTCVQKPRPKEFLSGNFLDSSNPKRSRGKHREIKKKKLSTFKRTIIKERILKQKMKEITIDTKVENVCFNLIDTINFKSEMKTYLNKLNEEKIKNVANIKSKVKKKQESTETKLYEEKEENAGNTSDIKEKRLPQVFSHGEIKFSSKFREYCDNIITSDLNSAVAELIKEIIKLQDKQFSRDPIKAKIKKRHVSGIREVRKYLTLKKVKMVIIAPNLEKLQMAGSIYDSVNELKSMANTQNVMYGFALDRYKLGRCAKKSVPVSAFAILNFEGIEDLYKNVMHKLQEAKKKFSDLTKLEGVKNDQNTEDVNSQIISLISTFREDLRVSKKVEPQSE